MPSSFCEACGRKTEYLFDGMIYTKATRYHPITKKRIGLIDVERSAKVCQRCRPPSNLEIAEMLKEGKRNARSTRRTNGDKGRAAQRTNVDEPPAIKPRNRTEQQALSFD